ncbi:DUF4406 domain-containing protein [Candidatus Pacearchaeota archaeon]|jgi:hypothetical protein|nr:DUF4406 domain-containing protein [Candidatus Pacearchaeota archaeon]
MTLSHDWQKSPLIYITGKYRGNVTENIALANAAAQRLSTKGFIPLCTHNLFAHWDDTCKKLSDNDFLAMTMELAKLCDALYLLNGWEDSEGSKKEYEYFKTKEAKYL